MNTTDVAAKLRSAWNEEAQKLNHTPWMRKLLSGELDARHYKGFLLETYHHAGLNPQIQAYATMFFRENPRDIISLFYKHAGSEIGHDLMALTDLTNLGEDEAEMKATLPLPSTVAFNAFVLYQIQFVNPVSYLGYLYHLEFLPTQHGDKYIQVLKSMGLPENALTFLEEHATVDVGHIKFMERYAKTLIKSEKDFNDVLYTLKASSQLHGKMLADAFENGERIFKK